MQVVEQRLLHVYCKRVDVAATEGDRDLGLGVGQWRVVEELRDALAVLDLDQQHLLAAARQSQRQRRGHRGLARPALARDDVQAHGAEVGHVPSVGACSYPRLMTTTWEYLTAPLLIHATKQILDNFGNDGWELVTVIPGPNPEQLVAYFKRPRS